MIWSGLLRHAFIVQQIARLLVELPSQTEIKCEIVLGSPVILKIQGNVILFEAKNGLPIRHLSREGRIRDECVEIRIGDSAIDFEQTIVGGPLPVVFASPLHYVLAVHHGRVVLQLINIDEAALREANALPRAEEASIQDSDLRRTQARSC